MAEDLTKTSNLSPAKRALLERMRKRVSLSSLPVIRRSQRTRAPLSFAQQRMWLIQQLDPQSYLYNEARALRIHGHVDLAVMERALNSIVERHEILRTTFEQDENGEPWQKIAPELRIELPCIDLSALPAERRTSELQAKMLEFGKQPFCLTELPLFRAQLFRLAADDSVLAMSFHHIISDGWTGGVMYRELGEFYDAHLRGTEPQVAELPVQYADYASWQREWMQGAVLENELQFWREHLKGAPSTLDLPTDRPRPEDLSYAGDHASVRLSPETYERLKSLCHSEATTLFPAMLAALDMTLARWSGQYDLVLGTISAVRDQTEIENLIGCFTNFLPLRGNPLQDETALEFLRRAKQSVLDGFAHQNCPFEKITEAVQPERALNTNPLYNVSLQVQNYPEMIFRTATLEARNFPFDLGVAFLDLRFVAEERAGVMEIDCEYNRQLFDRETIDKLLRGYASVLEQITLRPQLRIADIALPDSLLEQASKARKRIQKYTLAIAASFTAEPIRASLAFWTKELGINAEVAFAPYNQVFQQLLDPSGLLSANQQGTNIVLVRMTDWCRSDDDVEAQQEISRTADEFARALTSAARRSRTSILVGICPSAQRFTKRAGWAQFLAATEDKLIRDLEAVDNVHLITPQDVLKFYPVENCEDEYAEELGHIPYTPAFFAALGSTLARRMFALRSPARLVIVIDADQTLWDGRSADLSVRINSQGKPLQQFLLAQADAGMLLCAISRRSEEAVASAFAQSSGLLKEGHLVARRVNSSSIRESLTGLADELQIGLPHFVFISANQEAYAEAQAYLPQVLSLLLPANAEQIAKFLNRVWAFDQWTAPHTPGREFADSGADQGRLLTRIATDLFDAVTISRAIEQRTAVRDLSLSNFVAPRTTTEELVAGVWAQLLNAGRVGVHDNFFSLGGHSLLAAQVLARVRQVLGVELPLRTIFEIPTVAQLSERIDSLRRKGVTNAAPSIPKLADRQFVPLSFAQQRLWFLHQLEPENPAYNIPLMFRIRGPLRVDSLHRSLNRVVERHESLRTTFAMRNNEPVQVIHDKLALPLPVEDLSGIVGEEQAQAMQKLASEDANRAFDLSSGPLLRAKLLRMAEADHILLVTMHHIVSDRWSLGVLSQELAANYDAMAAGGAPSLPELRIQYADFAAWQRQPLLDELFQKQLDYWKKQLTGAPDLLELPADYSRPPVISGRGATQSIVLSHDLVSRLAKLGQNEGTTLFMTLLAAFQVLLSRYSGQEDLVVGSPIANRTLAELEPLIGFFINTLPLRGDLSGDPSFRELLGRTRETCLQAYAHQDVPFEKLVEELHPTRSLSHSPIFQVMFALQNAPMQTLKLAGVELERMPLYTGTSMFDLSWFALEVAEGLMIRAEYSTDLFSDSTITRALEHFQQLLESAVANPSQHISQLPLLTERERNQVLAEFNATDAEFPAGLRLQDFVERTAALQPETVAVVCEDEHTTYRQFNEQANQIAHHLIGLGAGPDVLVGVFLERGSHLLPAILGVLKSGSAYVPLDPSYPKDRISAILDDARAPIVLTQQSLREQVAGSAAKIICLDSDHAAIARAPKQNPAIEVKPENLAYVLFTSGSTGRPKGVALEHRSAAMFVHWAQTVFSREELQGVLLSTSVCFDLSVFEIFVPLSAGGKVIVVQNALYLPSAPARDQVTLINTVPSAMAELVRMNAVPRSVKTINMAGEALSSALVNDIYASTSATKVYNLYGPTEDTTYSTYTLTQPNTRVTIGRPLPNTQAYILDQNQNPAPIGVPGELYLAGAGLARGYFGRADLTAERFLANPFGSDKNPRMYKTGDLCRWLPNGEIEYLGRMDHQVKIRGFRIELGEIEAVLARHPAVRQVLVLAREDHPGMKRLVAYFISQNATAPDDAELIAHLRKSLPEFMVPSAFVRLEAFPLTPNGKIDRKALPAPESKKDADAGYIAPRTPGEEKLAAIWAQVLHLDRVSADAHFFVLGGHSLLAAQVISRIRQAFSVELPLKAMFESPKLEALAARVASTKPESDVLAIRRVSREKPLPASFAQQRLWFLDQLEPNSPAYNIAYTLKITGSVEVDIIEKSLNLMAARHESLRTSFGLDGETPVQKIQTSVQIPFRKIDLTNLDPNAREAEARRFIADEANRPFSLSQAPLARMLFLTLGEGDHYLLISIHHIISDRWSLSVITQELASAYGDMVEGRTPQLPELTLQYADYSEWQRERLGGEALQKQLAYWKDKLRDAPPVLELSTDRPRPATESFHGDVTCLSISRELSDKLKQVSYAHGGTLFMTLLAGIQALLARYSGQEDIVIGTAVANRTHPELEKVVGLFLNTLPLRTQLNDDPSFSEILTRAKETALGAYANQDMPFEKLVEELNPARSLSHSPLVQVYFVLQNAPTESLQLKGLALKPVPSGLKTVKGDMYLSMHETEHGLEARLEYSTDLFEAGTMERFLGHFQVLLQAAAENPSLKLSELPLLTDTERQTILVDWNATYSDYPRDACLHQLFEQQAESTPDAIACVFPGDDPEQDQQITYLELNERSNRLAHYLRRHGAIAGRPLAIFIERSLEMMIGLIGIQKAGTTYIPLDPGYPPDRLKLALEDAKVPIVITLQDLMSSLPETHAKVICLDRDWPQIAQERATNPVNVSDPADLLYVIFTSGSTGTPKGVQVPQRAVVNLLSFMADILQVGPHDVFPALAPFAFDMCIPELYLALITGGRVVIVRREVATDGEALAALLRRTGATIVHATPTTWSMLLDAGFDGKGLKRAIGAEPVPPELCRRMVEADPSLYNFYGPTETTVWSTYHHFVSPNEPVVVGKPLANTQVYILDKNQQPLPVGAAGEIHIGGEGVSNGYLNRPDLTADKFIPNPFATEYSLHTRLTNGLLPFEVFELQSTRVSNRVAATFGNETLTYQKLNSRANQLARHLRALGVRPDVLVGLYLDRSLDMLVALFGVLKAGGAYVPLDPAFPRERIAFIIGDSKPAVIITQKPLMRSIPETAAQIVCIDSDWESISVESPEPLATCVFPNNLAYLLYTSGSTGTPKGVQIEHGALRNFLLSMKKQPGLRPTDRLLALTTLSFDIAGLELYLPLITGATVILASREEATDPNRLLALIQTSKPTVMQATPATWRMLINAGWKGSQKLKVLCGGESLPPELARDLLPHCAELWNMYGPTETTIWSSIYRVTSEFPAAAPIGRPIDRTSMYVLSEHMQPVPVGVAGELYIGGDGLARGYHHRPELTSERFVRDPFSPKPGARLYRTGDLARFLPDGNIQYLGRTDFQVKVRGFRIELGEIEAALAKHPAVRQAVVAAREDTPGDKRLVAYLVMQSAQHLPIADVRAHLKQSLPDYMIPSAVVEMDALPLTANGKVDRKHLPAPDYRALESSSDGRRPPTATEEIIAGIFAEVLKVRVPGTDDDFFDLGGHSLLATQLTSRVRQAFHTELPLRALFEAPTIAGLAQRVEASRRGKHGLQAPPIRSVPRGKPLPVSFSQQRLWFLDQLEPGSPLYNVAYVTRIQGALRTDILEWSINEIIQRHESLRTTFHTVDDQPMQFIAPALEFRLEQLDISHLPTLEERESGARNLASREIQRPFDLTRGPLLRGLLILIGDEDYGLILTTHHIISDRWSLSVFSQEMATLYESRLLGKPSPLAELEFQYADFAVWQRDYLSGPVLDKQLSYWRQQLDGAPPVLELPTDRPRSAAEHFWGARHLQAIPEDLAASLRALSRAQRGTFFMSLLAGFQLLLGKLSGQDDVVVGTDLANRNQLETERMIGFFVNLLPMRARIRADASFKDFFQQVRDSSLDAMAHQDIPFDKLVEELRPERSLTHNPLVQVLFVMQNTPPEASEFGGLKLCPLGVSSSSRFDLVLFVNNPETQPTAMWVYNPKLFDASTIARTADAYELVLKTICADPDVKIATLFAGLQQFEEAQRGQEQKKFQEAGLEKLRKVRRKALEVS